MAIFRGIGGAGDSTTDATLTAVTQQATNAASSATAASSSASAAATSASSASTSASNAASSEVSGAASATSATASAISATASKVAAAASETAAGASETAAAASESAAATSASNAASSASSASASASTATTQASSATSSAATATTKASEAVTSASNAATSETNAASSASAAASSASSASASADAALTALDNFDDRYLGQKASDPTVDNDGNALVAGALYFNTTDSVMKVYEGSIWVAAYASLSGALIAANNLSDLASVIAARTNLGLGTAATTDATDYATAAQGATADTAVQPNDTVSFAGLSYTGTLTGGTGVVNIGSGQVYKDGSGNLGVGTSSPTGKFHVVGGRSTFAPNSENFAVYLQHNSATSGFYVGSPSADAMAFSASSGAERMRIDSAGNVGIGTTSISGKLSINGEVYAAAGSVSGVAYGFYPKGTYGNTGMFSPAPNTVAFATTGGERVRIDSSGNVGIGTSSPTNKLHVVGTAKIEGSTLDLNDAGTFTISQNTTASALVLRTATSSYLRFDTNGANERMRIDSSGNVGIGTTDTSLFNSVGGSTRLAVCGSSASTDILGNTGASISIINTDTTANNTAGLHFARADTDDTPNYAGASIVAQFPDTQVASQYPKGLLTFLTSTTTNAAPSEKMRIDSSGNVGIGTASPSRRLVAASPSATKLSTGQGALFTDTANDGGVLIGSDFAIGSIQGCNAAGTSAKNIMLQSEGGNVGVGITPSYKLHVSGDIYATGNVTAYSDIKLKTNIRTIEGALNLVGKMRGVRYDRIDTGEASVGVIAQEMREVLPEVVTEKDGAIGVAYGNISGVLIEAINELRAEVTELRAEIKALKGV
jgi:hypothetical protein